MLGLGQARLGVEISGLVGDGYLGGSGSRLHLTDGQSHSHPLMQLTVYIVQFAAFTCLPDDTIDVRN